MACSRRWRGRNKKAFELAQPGGRRGKTGADCRALRYEAQALQMSRLKALQMSRLKALQMNVKVNRSSDMDDQRNLILHLCQH